MDPEDVTSPALAALDQAIDHNRKAHEILATYRAVEYTRTYHKLRMQRIRQNAPIRHGTKQTA
jgi:hypothetical protein